MVEPQRDPMSILESMSEASRTLLATLAHQDPIPALLQLAQGTMRATAAGLALVLPEGTGLHVEICRGDGWFGEGAVRSLAQQALEAREALRDPSFEAGHPHSGEAGIPVGSILAFPLEVRNATLGALVLWRDKGVAPFEVFEQRQGKILAAEIALALDNARLCRELSRKAEEFARDITERKGAEQRLRESEAKYRNLLENLPQKVFHKNENSVYVACNENYARDLRVEPQEITGKTDYDFYPKELAEKYRADDTRIQRSGHTEEFDEGYIQDGEHRIVHTIKVPLRDDQGTSSGILGVFWDITEKKRVEEALQEASEMVRAVIRASPVAIFTLAPDGTVQMWNPTAEQMFGWSEQEVLGRPLPIVPEESEEESKALQERVIRGESISGVELHRRKKDGSWIDVSLCAAPLRDVSGQTVGLLGMLTDITERKRAEEALIEERHLLRTLMDNVPDCIYFKDRQSRFLRTSRAHARVLGLGAPGQAVGKTDFDFYTMEQAHQFYSDEQEVITTSKPVIAKEEKETWPDGRVTWFSTTKMPLRDADGAIIGTFGVSRDITEQKRAEAELMRYAQDLESAKAAEEEHAEELARLVEELARERELLRALMDNLPDSIYFKDRQSRFLRINMALAKAFGLSDPVVAAGKTDFDFFTAEHAQPAYDDEQEVIRTGKPMMAKEEKETWPDGRVTWASTVKMPFRNANGAVIGTFGVSRNITDRKRAEEAIRASEERYRELFENASDLVFTTDLEARRLTSLNRVAEQTIGYSREEAARMEFQRLVDPRHWHRIEEARQRLLAGESAVTFELEARAKDGRRVMLEVKPGLIYKEGKPVEMQGIGRDITGREVAEMELRHAQKLESVGRLASGIAHEINTPIQFVGDNTRFLQDSFAGLQTLLSKYQELRDAATSGTVSLDLLAEVRRVEEESDCAYLLEEIPKALTQTLDGVTRVATIVRAMKDFAHPESKEKAATDLNKALLSTLTVARNELKYVADVETDLGDLPLVVCNISDLNQVFLNLLVNAAHAIGEVVKGTGEKGKIRVRTVADGKTVLVTITDTGCGIPEGIHSKVFDPFFTTKEVGRGTGQGLAIARSVVVERHKGSLTFESEVGKGTTFYLRLPVDSEERSEETRVP
jgi:PAS domain S-box-containing protein